VSGLRQFLVITERDNTSYGAHAPDPPGCVAVGDTREEIERETRAAIALHLQGMIEDHEPVPSGDSPAEFI
jgi:predicted RNase H-like HicB family nuclease